MFKTKKIEKESETPFFALPDGEYPGKWSGYICFKDGEVFWTLHSNGWEAFLPNKIDPCHSTYDYMFPSDDDLAEAMWKYEDWRKSDSEL